MNNSFSIFPVHDPLLIFLILTGIILLSPFLFRLIKIPDVASFIIMGVVVGPSGFAVLNRDSSIELLGTIGLLYIMFMAGLELDPEKLKSNRRNSLVFGLSTFIIPAILGYLVSKNILNLDHQATLLVSLMFSTHTLVAYPLVRKLGVNRDDAVPTAIGGTIITDTLVLLLLSIITQSPESGEFDFKTIILLLLFGVYTILIFYSFPRIASWFFRHIKRDRPVHYLFLLFLVCLSSFIAEIIGIESIIGAFLAGLALNRSIPKNSLLMHHIDFVGNILFIPVFLIGTGMLIDTRILISGTGLWIIAGILIITAFAGKWLAAYISQKTLGFNSPQRNLLFGLSSSHAAATLAIITIGYEKQMIDITVFNATILIILTSSLAASIITEKAGKKVALLTKTESGNAKIERLLVAISNPTTMSNLINTANCFHKRNPGEPIYVLNILSDNKSSRENILRIQEELENNVSEYNNLNENLKVITRVDLSISGGIIRTAKEHLISDIVFGWGGRTTTSQRLFGNILDHLQNSLQTLYAVNLNKDLHDYRTLVIHIPANLEYEPAFASIIQKLNKIPGPDDRMIFRLEKRDSIAKISPLLPKRNKHEVSYVSEGFNEYVPEPGSINIFFHLRKQSLAYHSKKNMSIQKMIAMNSDMDFIMIVPGYE